MVLVSYYPVHGFDPTYVDNDKKYQTDCMVHEGIHAIQASMPGCKRSGWFYEGSDCWLQGTMESERSGKPASLGWLSASSVMAPFQPIECYSGWLQDGSFGGPSAEGVNIFDQNHSQICTWRRLLGGSQYSELFPYYLELVLGKKVWLGFGDTRQKVVVCFKTWQKSTVALALLKPAT